LKKLKIIILAIVIISTLLSILYLSYIAEQMERYTISRSDGEKCFVLFTSTSGSLSDGKNISSLLTDTQKALNDSGYDAVIIGNKEDVEEKLKANIKNNKKYIFMDINTTKLLTSKNSVILRVGNNYNSKYDENFEYAKSIKENAAGLKTTIISDSKNNYYQELAYKAVRIEISGQSNYEEAENCITIILKTVIQ
jgi:hypothetical protein